MQYPIFSKSVPKISVQGNESIPNLLKNFTLHETRRQMRVPLPAPYLDESFGMASIRIYRIRCHMISTGNKGEVQFIHQICCQLHDTEFQQIMSQLRKNIFKNNTQKTSNYVTFHG